MYFVIVTGVPNGDESYISMVDTTSSRAAHAIAISDFRRTRDIPSNVHVHSETVFKSADIGEASRFHKELMSRIAVAEAAIEEINERRTG